MKVNLPYVIPDTDRHGNVRYYFRRPGRPKIRILVDPTSKAFVEQYYLVRDGKVEPKQSRPRLDRSASGTFRRLCEEYYASSEFGQLGKRTAHVRRLILEGICQSRNSKGKDRGGLPFALIEDRHIRELRDEKAKTPEAANSRLKALRQLFGWAKATGRVSNNSTLEVKRLSSASKASMFGAMRKWRNSKPRIRLGRRHASPLRCFATPVCAAPML
jgi:hypothetical protein